MNRYDKAKRVECKYCNKSIVQGNIERHENSCIQNPKYKKTCPVCNKEFFTKDDATTCSYSCSNTFFRTGSNHGNWKTSTYRTTCFEHHEKKCVVCGEERIVEVHHYDEDKTNNDPENLVPLCPTHHQYWHSRFRDLVQKQVDAYRESRKNT